VALYKTPLKIGFLVALCKVSLKLRFLAALCKAPLKMLSLVALFKVPLKTLFLAALYKMLAIAHTKFTYSYQTVHRFIKTTISHQYINTFSYQNDIETTIKRNIFFHFCTTSFFWHIQKYLKLSYIVFPLIHSHT
jgi:hypothetical protein